MTDALRLLAEAHDALAGMSDSDLDTFEDEEEELEAVPMQYAARKVMAAMELLQAAPRFAGVTPKGLTSLADSLSAGITTGHDWPNTQDELDRLGAASVLRWLANSV